MLTIGRLARRNGLSRSTLLYYDSIGLLSPSQRGKNGYRLYTQEDQAGLQRILTLRQAGLSLEDIKRVMQTEGAGEQTLSCALLSRLEDLNTEIDSLREQQRFILGLLGRADAAALVGVMNKKTWTELLAAAGFSEQDMWNWHRAFEAHAPQKHQAFLEFLCIPDAEIKTLRMWSRRGAK